MASFIRAVRHGSVTPQRTAEQKPNDASKSSFVKSKSSAPKPEPSYVQKKSKKELSVPFDQINILQLDQKIQDQLRANVSTLPQLRSELQRLLWIMVRGVEPLDQIMAKKQVTMVRRRIQDLEGAFELAHYLLRSAPIIEEYKALMTKYGPKSFVPQRTNSSIEDRKQHLQEEFMCIAREYLDLSGYPTRTTTTAKCASCGGTSFEIEDETLYACRKCGVLREIFDESPSYKDNDRVNMSSRYTYTVKGHFQEAIDNFQATKNVNVPPSVYATLREEFALHNLNDEKKITKDHIYTFLNERGLSDYYTNINLIHYVITGIPAPDISHYVSKLLDMYDAIMQVYADTKDPSRVNSLAVNYVLYKLLQLLGYRCRKNDFFVLKTTTKLEEHDEKWHEIMVTLREKTGDTKYRYLPSR
jgi:VLTF3-like late transcription factor